MKDIFADDTDMTNEQFDAAMAAGIPADIASTPGAISDDWSDEDDYDPFEDPNYNLYVLKWVCDGNVTLDDVTATLRGQVEYFEGLKADGWELESAVENSHMHLRKSV